MPKVGFCEALLVMTAIVILLVICVMGKVGLQVPLFLSWFIMYLYAILKKIDYREIETVALDTIRSGFQAVMILLAVGALIGAWIICGTVPTLIYYGLELVNPNFFLLTTLLFCSIISLATGTSYGTAGTGGLAMMGIGLGLGFPPEITAGAVIAGALFGDKLSPFSDTTNLSAAMAGADLFDHVKHMLYTTTPSYIISAIVFTIMGFKFGGANFDQSSVTAAMNALSANFIITPVLLIPIIVVITLLVKRFPAVQSILVGALLGVIFALIYQNATLIKSLSVLWSGFKINSDIVFVSKLLNRGGIVDMTGIAMIMIFAMGLGGMLEKTGILQALLRPLVDKITSTGRLILSTCVISYIASMIGSTQAFSHVMTGKLLKPVFEEKGLAARNLSRTMEDSGTLCGVLIPWHTNSVFMAGVLGVPSLAFIPYCFFSWITPIIAIIYGYTGWFILTREKEQQLDNK